MGDRGLGCLLDVCSHADLVRPEHQGPSLARRRGTDRLELHDDLRRAVDRVRRCRCKRSASAIVRACEGKLAERVGRARCPAGGAARSDRVHRYRRRGAQERSGALTDREKLLGAAVFCGIAVLAGANVVRQVFAVSLYRTTG